MIDLEAIKDRQRRFACFCWDPQSPNSEGHHPECMSADINQDVRDLIAEVEALRHDMKYARFE